MARAPVLVPHIEILAREEGASVYVHAHEAYSVLLTSQLCDRILIPAPNPDFRRSMEARVNALPTVRRARIKLVDTHGTILKRVQNYLEPIFEGLPDIEIDSRRGKARIENPGPIAIDASLYERVGTGLYLLALGCNEKSAVFSRDLLELQRFLSSVDPGAFSSEARHRIGEVIGVAASYAPVEVPQLALQQAESTLPLDDILDEIMASAEYHTVIEASGRLGLLKNPKVLLRELRIRTRDLLKREDARRFLEAAEGTAGIAVSTNAGIQLPSFLNAGAGKGGFAPPFLSSWASFAQVAGAAVRPLREANMSASEIYFRSNNPFNLNNRYYPISPAPGITDVDFQTQVEVARRVKVRAAAFA